MAGERREPGPDSAAELMAAMGRLMASQLRSLAPQPFGLVNDELRLPAFVSDHSHQASAVQDIMSAPVTRMTLCYGIREDPLSPYIGITTDFTPDHSETVALRFELGKAVSGPGHRPPRGPLGHGRLDIVVAGSPRTAQTQIYQNFHGLQFTHSGLLVTGISRGPWPPQPRFALITDLEPYLAPLESADSEVIRAKIRALSAGPG